VSVLLINTARVAYWTYCRLRPIS